MSRRRCVAIVASSVRHLRMARLVSVAAVVPLVAVVAWWVHNPPEPADFRRPAIPTSAPAGLEWLKIAVCQSTGCDLVDLSNLNSISDCLDFAEADYPGALTRYSVDEYERRPDLLDRPAILVRKNEAFAVVLSSFMGPDGVRLLQVIANGRCQVLPIHEVSLRSFTDAWSFQPAPQAGLSFGGCMAQIDKFWHGFGLVDPMAKVSASIRVSNSGREPFQIGEPSSSCGCVSFSPSGDAILEPGESQEFTVDVLPGSETSFMESIRLPLHALKSGVAIECPVRLLGAVREWARVYPRHLDFGTVVAGDDETISRHVFLTETVFDSFSIESASSSLAAVSASVLESTSVDGTLKKFKFLVVCDPALLSHGSSEGVVTIHTTSELQPKVSVPFQVNVLRPLAVIPETISFGLIGVGDTRSKAAEIRWRQANADPAYTNTPLIATIESTPDWCVAQLAIDGTVAVLTITARPEAIGHLEDEVVVRIDGPRKPELVSITCVANAVE